MPLISRNARNWMHGSQFWSMSKSKPGVNKKGQETLRYAYFNTLASNWLQSWKTEEVALLTGGWFFQ